MHTNTETTPEVKPVVTEADVVAFIALETKRLRLELAPLVEAAQLRGVDLNVFTGSSISSVVWQVSAFNGEFKITAEIADTIAEAVSKFTAKVRASIPDADQLRKQAAELTARAEAIEAGAKKPETATA